MSFEIEFSDEELLALLNHIWDSRHYELDEQLEKKIKFMRYAISEGGIKWQLQS